MDNPFEFHEEDGIIACVGDNGGTTDEDIKNGFKRTVEILTESLKDGQEVEDLLVYPIVYNARHSIELSLKIVINLMNRFIFWISVSLNIHWELVQRVYQERI